MVDPKLRPCPWDLIKMNPVNLFWNERHLNPGKRHHQNYLHHMVFVLYVIVTGINRWFWELLLRSFSINHPTYNLWRLDAVRNGLLKRQIYLCSCGGMSGVGSGTVMSLIEAIMCTHYHHVSMVTHKHTQISKHTRIDLHAHIENAYSI